MSGGGISGFVIIGMIKALENLKIINLNNINTFIGSSVGSMYCLILSSGYSIDDVQIFCETFNFSRLIPEINSEIFFSKYGVDEGKKIMIILENFLKNKKVSKTITFKEHYEKFNKKIIFTVTNYSKGIVEYLSHETYPDMPIVLGCRMSISIPFYFIPIVYNDCIYMDGCILDPFPIDLGNKDTTLGIYIYKLLNDNKLDKFQDTIGILIRLVMNKLVQSKLDNPNILKINISNENTINFDLDFKDIRQYINIGYNDVIDKYKYNLNGFIQEIILDILYNISLPLEEDSVEKSVN
jgi:NTE family protein